MATSPAHNARVRTAASDLDQGNMNLRAHERTFDGFIRLMTWSAVASILVLIFLALTNA